MSGLHEASLRQIAAANPTESTWLSANAGSGKTKVLTDRVARLLLAGTEPQRILCLTYTKAAASEMQNRLLRRLGDWAMLEDRALRAELAKLGEDLTITPDLLLRARRLFAQAIETPGGLKIQTIHSFCAALLRRFPLEAGVAHGFAELDDRSAARLREDLLEEIAAGPDRAVFDRFVRLCTDTNLPAVLAAISQNRDAFPPDLDREGIFAALDLPADFSESALLAETFAPGDLRLLQDLTVPLLKAEKNDLKLGQALATITTLDMGALLRLEGVLLYGKSAANPFGPKIDAVPTKAMRAGPAASYVEALNDLIARVAEARPRRLALATAERTAALHDLARALLPKLAARKAAQGWLDFEDLIARARDLLSDPSVAQWVLFRLDGGIDHILVDEAQDTSPGQWAVIERLTDEFTSGQGARDVRRTIFVVGDRKQSIYSFQGADLARFQAMQSHFSEKFAAARRPLQTTALLHSFRSSQAILRLTDLTFAAPGLSGLGGPPEHIAFHEFLPGRVDLWEPVAQGAKPEEGPWWQPVDQPAENDARIALARAVAAEIRAMIDQGVQIPTAEGARPVHEGDFLILVQSRKELFAELIRACKAAGLEVAGVDRMQLGSELAVKDIVSLLTFLATPEDDLALAEALRSPIFGWSEDMLFRLAQPRKGYLWEALRKSEISLDSVAILQDLLDHTDFLRPFDLIERILSGHGARHRLVARLGVEVEDGIDELLSQALIYEQRETPSLTGFLGWLGADEIAVKRQLESGGRAIRVMTVHGAKGLEAPIVILPDTAKPRPPRARQILQLETMAAWATSAEEMPPPLAKAREAVVQAEQEERLRLLYVALTRAEKWLIVAAAGETGQGGDSWYSLVADGLEKAGAETIPALSHAAREIGEIRRYSHGDWPPPGAAVVRQAVAATEEIPYWARRPAPRPEKRPRALSPSDLGGEKALAGEALALGDDSGKRRGTQLHLLLEHLPGLAPEQWPEQAPKILLLAGYPANSAEIETILAETGRVLASPEMAEFLAPGALAEVELTAALDELGGARIHGTIDRLVITKDRVRVLDYKSNAVVPRSAAQVPLGILRQMAAYRAALRQIYPGRAIDCLILWTRNCTLMPLTDAQLDAAIRTAT